MRLFYRLLVLTLIIAVCRVSVAAEPRHVVVFQAEGRFGGWPANGGMWAWGNEILVSYTEADHKDVRGHTYDRATARHMFARSLDGGETWTREDAFASGITGQAADHRPGERAEPPRDLTDPMDFAHPDFALLFQPWNYYEGPSHFYYTSDRGESWAGPFCFPNLDTGGFAARTDYVIDGRHEMLVFLTAGREGQDGREARVAAMRTMDGGRKWERLAWVNSEPGRSIMPATVRLSSQKLLTVIRHRHLDEGTFWLTSYLSTDNARRWRRLDDPVFDQVNSPPALLALPDGRLVLAYVFRRGSGRGSSVCVRISGDEGQSWSDEIELRGDEGASSDVGYPRIARRPDGKLLIAYYWNHALHKDLPRYRYIAATIWDAGSR